MKRFCKECGQEARPQDHMCIHCGTPLDPIKETQEPEPSRVSQVPKEPMSKKKKILWGSVIGVVLLLVGAHLWVSSYFDPGAVEERFETAVSEKDAKALSKLMIHEDGESIREAEAEAFLQLVELKGKRYLDGLYDLTLNGTFIGIYDTYKMGVVDQYTFYDDFVEGLSFTYDGIDLPIHEEGETIIFGPLAPGVYDVEATYEGDYSEASVADTVVLDRASGDYVSIGMNVPISMVTFTVTNKDQFDVSTAKIILEDEEISFSSDGTTEAVGPLLTNGSQTIQTVVEMPWGEVTSEEIAVDEADMVFAADLMDADGYEQVTTTLKDFKEQYMESLATKSTKPLDVANDQVKDDLKESFDNDYFYAGQLDAVEIDKASVVVKEESDAPTIGILVKYTVEEDDHYVSGDPDLSAEEQIMDIELRYEQEDENWIVTAHENSFGFDFADADVMEGSKELYKPSDDMLAEAEDRGIEEQLEDFMIDYTVANVEAINKREFSILEGYLTSDGPRKQEADDYIDYLQSRDIYEEWISTSLEKAEEISDNMWKVTVIEEFEIIRPDSSDVKEFKTVVHVKEIDDEFYVDELIETNET